MNNWTYIFFLGDDEDDEPITYLNSNKIMRQEDWEHALVYAAMTVTEKNQPVHIFYDNGESIHPVMTVCPYSAN